MCVDVQQPDQLVLVVSNRSMSPLTPQVSFSFMKSVKDGCIGQTNFVSLKLSYHTCEEIKFGVEDWAY